ncbi:hypothetical protein [Haliangium sp.]|uniref:hypothetical protein n=1 Tax=Haliangium sp. TaxID=2663208 RepID=UPI003D0F7778
MPPTVHFHRLSLALAALVLAACGSNAPTPEQPQPEPSPKALIIKALSDAEIAAADEVVNDLPALVPGTEPMKWQQDEAGDDWVLLVTWTDWEGFREQVGQTVPVERALWVSAVPEVQSFCRNTGLEGEPLEQRLERYLGLRPGTAKPYFVAMWARPADVVRPCADPEVTDTTCSVGDEPADVTIGSHEHRAWFDELRMTSYGPEGKPWTRLGYTYDWDPSSPERGAGEFLIPAQTMVKVESFETTAAYCVPGS